VGGHNPVVGMGSNFDVHDLLKPHLMSPAVPLWSNAWVIPRDWEMLMFIFNQYSFALIWLPPFLLNNYSI